MALKPKDITSVRAFAMERRASSTPVLHQADLDAQRREPAVRERLQRVGRIIRSRQG